MKNKHEETLDALELVNDFELLCPINLFKYFSIHAIIIDYSGDINSAKRFARDSLSAMEMKESPFRYHKKLGLVKNRDWRIVRQLSRI